MLLIAFSETDLFSKNVFQKFSKTDKLRLVKDLQELTLYELENVKILYDKVRDLPFIDYVQELKEKIPELSEVRYIICVSRHEMKNPRPLLTVHTSGNWLKAEYGGIDNKVSLCDARLNSNLIRLMHKLALDMKINEKYNVAMEATHHGPSVDMYVTFIEVGSTPSEWLDEKCHEVFIHLLSYIIEKFDTLLRNDGREIYVNIGDLHYLTITNHVLNGEYDVGHTIPKYVKPSLENVSDAIVRTGPEVNGVIIHWKSVDRDVRELVVKVCEERRLKIIKRK